MTDQPETWSGWTLSEALERTADPDLWKAWVSSRPESDRQLDALIATAGPLTILKENLWEHFSKGKLIVTGVRKRGARSVVLDTLTLHAFNIPDWKGSIGRGDQTAQIQDIRVFPVLRSPDAAKRVIGLSLAQAFRAYVLGDPEVTALGKPLARDVTVFRDGQFPGPFENYHWPLDLTAAQCAYNFAPTDALGRSGEASSEQSHASVVLADRLQGLRGLLSTGTVVARGTSVQTDGVTMIAPSEWARPGVLIDVRKGDFCEQENHKPKIRWSSISLEAPPSAGHP